jgi:CAAX protease family protein
MAFPTLAIWLYFYAAPEPGAMRLLYGASKALQFGFPIAWALAVERWRPRRAAASGGGAASAVALGLATGLAAGAGIAFGYPALLAGRAALAGAPQGIAAKLADFGVATPAAFLLLAAFYSLAHSFLEEYYWRWFVFGRLRRRLPPRTAGIVSALAFASHHVLLLGVLLGGFGPATWLLAALVAAAGGVWAWLYHKSGSLLAPWASHALADAGLMWIGYRLWTSAGGG